LKEKLEQYALFAEIIGGIAIIVTLVFVGLQVRQSNSLATTDALKDGTQLWTNAYVAAFGAEEGTAFFRKAIDRCEEMSKDEQGRFFATMTRFISAYDNIFNQYEAGRLREEVFLSIASVYYAIVETPCAQKVLLHDLPLMPPYLVTPRDIEALSGHEDDMKLPDFLVE
jgi:hypothetical protein